MSRAGFILSWVVQKHCQRHSELFSAVLTEILLADKTEDDADREAQLLEMRLTLTEERNAVMVPSAGSGIPGAPAEW